MKNKIKIYCGTVIKPIPCTNVVVFLWRGGNKLSVFFSSGGGGGNVLVLSGRSTFMFHSCVFVLVFGNDITVTPKTR